MPQATYTVKFPDGYVQKFQGPDDMSDSDAFARATQERAISSGKVQTTWFGGAAKQMGQEKAANAALIGGAGMLTGTAPLVAAAPLVARWIDYATKKVTGENPTTPTIADQATDVGVGLASAYGPALLARTGGIIGNEISQLPTSTLPQALAKAGTKIVAPVSGEAAMITPAAVGSTVSELGQAASNTAARVSAGVSAEDLALMKAQVAQGMKPMTAAKIISGGNARILKGLMNLYRLPEAGLK